MGRNQLCVYCGTKEATTRDHVAPLCLFVDPKPPNLLTVPVCEDCNNEKSRDDTILRDVLMVDIDNSHPIAQHLLATKVKRAVERNRSEVARLVAQAGDAQPRHDHEGKYLGDAHKADLPPGTMDRILSRMVHGLFFSERRAILPNEHELVVLRQPAATFPALYGGMANPLARTFGHVFGFTWVRTPDPLRMLWLLWFYDSVVYSVTSKAMPREQPTADDVETTAPPAADDAPDAGSSPAPSEPTAPAGGSPVAAADAAARADAAVRAIVPPASAAVASNDVSLTAPDVTSVAMEPTVALAAAQTEGSMPPAPDHITAQDAKPAERRVAPESLAAGDHDDKPAAPAPVAAEPPIAVPAPTPEPELPAPPSTHAPASDHSDRGAWKSWVMLIATVVAAIASVAAVVLNTQSERRAAKETVQRKSADSVTQSISTRTLEAVQRNAREAEAQDSVRNAVAGLRADARRAEAIAAAESETQRRSQLRVLDGEMAVRLALLTDSLNSIGFEPTPSRQPGEGAHYGRLSRAFQLFVSPRDNMSQGLPGLSTHELLSNIATRDDDPEVRRALLYLGGITPNSPHLDFSGATWLPSGADTPSVSFFEPRSHERALRPIVEVLQAFSLKRWAR